MKTVKGFQYSVTANEEVVITDANGLNLTCPAGQQTYFVATGDEVEVVGDAVITQTRGGIIAGGGGGGGGEKIAPGEVVVGGTQGSAFIAQLNECTECPMFLSELPEGVTFENLRKGTIPGLSEAYYELAFPFSGGHFGGGIFAQSTISAFPSTLNLINMINGNYMFNYCSNLTSWNVALPALAGGYKMFNSCSNLTSWNVALPALTDGSYMFSYCSKLTSWDVDLPALTNGEQMFRSCSGLTSFESDMPKLSNGYFMFNNCTNLTSFNCDLPALTNGSYMFNNCKLDLSSLNRIVSTVPSYTSGSHSITIGVNKNEVTQEQQNSANAILVGKGWTVTWQRN